MDSDGVKEMQLRAAAERAAAQYAPPPIVEPHVGGCWGAAFAIGVMVLFSALAGIETGYAPVLVTIVICFILPVLYFSSQEKRHRKATLVEFERLKTGKSN